MVILTKFLELTQPISTVTEESHLGFLPAIADICGSEQTMPGFTRHRRLLTQSKEKEQTRAPSFQKAESSNIHNNFNSEK